MNKKLIRKMLTASGGPLRLTPEELKYLEWSKMTPLLKREYRTNRAKSHLLSGPNITNFWEAFQSYIGNRDPENPHLSTGEAPNPGIRNSKQILKVFTGVPKKYLESFPTYKGEIWAGPTVETVLSYAKNGKVFPIQYETNGVRILDIDSKGKISEKGIKLTDVPEDILKLYNEAGILESPVYMSLYNLSKFANKIKPTVIRAKNVKDAKKGIFDYTIIGENVPRTIIKKQGGKMNIIEFLKNGSGIHIKEKNKGKFTDYCGGKVTDECILKGKNSSNPAIRKRATFADNARHFKHLKGGIIKAYQGTKTTTGLNSDLGWAIVNRGLNLLQTGILLNELTNAQSDASKIRNKLQWNQIVKLLIKQNLNDTNNQYLHWVYDYLSGRLLDRPNLMVAKHMGYLLLSLDLAEGKDDLDYQNSLIDYQTRLKTAQNWGNAIEGVLQEGLKSLSSYYLNNKTSTNSSTANSPTISSPTTNSFLVTPSLTSSTTKSFWNNSSLT